MKKISEQSFFYLLILLLVCFIYYPILTAKLIIDHDYPIVILPLLKLDSLTAYFQALQSNILFDLQPVRDLSLFAAIKLTKILSIDKLIVYYNFLLWLFCLLLSFKFLKKVSFSNWQSSFIVCLIAVHPVFTQTVPWMSAHKHLLAFFFSLLCLNSFFPLLSSLKQSKTGFVLTILFYLLAVFSQPIFLTLPIWLALFLLTRYSYKEIPKPILTLVGILTFIMIAVAALNIWYYAGPYTAASQSHKFISLGLTERLLSFGRYFSQVIFPVSFARHYYYGSSLNIYGLLLLPIAFMIFNKALGAKKTLLWGALFFLPLLMVNIKQTNIFVSDTYLLIPALGLIVLIFCTLEKLSFKCNFPQRYNIIAYFALIFILTIQARVEARHWIEPMTYVKVSYEREKSCMNILNYATYLWRFPEHREEATKRTQELVVQGCQFKTFPSVFFSEARNAIAASIYFTEELTLDAKVSILRQSPNPYAKLFLANVYLKKNSTDKALKIIDDIFKVNNYVFLDLEKDPALNELNKFCENNKEPACHRINSHLDKIKSSSNTPAQNAPEAAITPDRRNNLQ